MTQLHRRTFQRETVGSLLTYALLETLLSSPSMGEQVRRRATEWLSTVDQMSRDLKGRRLTQVEWQDQVEALFQQIDLQEFLRFVDFEQLTRELKFRSKGERALRPVLPEVDELPTKLVFGHQLFALRKDRSVAPHGHYNMATAFLVLAGKFAGRHYDRVEEEEEHLIIRPTIDRKFGAGESSTISDDRDNVHWFKATSDRAFIFNIHVLNVDPDVKQGGRVYVDPAGEPLADGRIRAAKISASEAYRRYG